MATIQDEDLSNNTVSNETTTSSSIGLNKRHTNVITTVLPSDICPRCEKRVYITERFGPIKDSFYHKLCFKCSICDRRLELKTYCTNSVDLNDKAIYCQNDAPCLRKSTAIDHLQISNSIQSQQMFEQGREKITSTHHFTGVLPTMPNDFMKEQNELKAYYDSFPNIHEVTNEFGSNIEKAKELTESIMKELPSGELNDKNTMCHVLNNLLGDENDGCLFYDSTNCINLPDASGNLVDVNLEDKTLVLKLNNSNGLGDENNERFEENDLQLVQTINDAIILEEFHPVIDDILERLSKAHDVEKNLIEITRVYYGSFNIVYTIRDLGKRIIKKLEKIEHKLKEQFNEFVSAKIHPLLYRPSFDISYFDERGNKNFSNQSETYKVGPPGRRRLYTVPYGWTRYGLKVFGKYSNDYWLHPFQDPRNWYRAYHGTGNARSVDFKNSNKNFDKEFVPVDALASIFTNEFRTARVTAHGAGVYCSPNPKFPEKGYTSKIHLDTKKGKKVFKCMLQVAVNPDGVKFATKDIWVVPDPKDIRPYGILIKEIA